MARKNKRGGSPSRGGRRDHHRIKLRMQRRPEFIEEQKKLGRRKKYNDRGFRGFFVYATNSVAKIWREPCYFHDDEKYNMYDYVRKLRSNGLEVVVHRIEAYTRKCAWFDALTPATIKHLTPGLARFG